MCEQNMQELTLKTCSPTNAETRQQLVGIKCDLVNMLTADISLPFDEPATSLVLVYLVLNGRCRRVRLTTYTRDLSIWFTVYATSQ